MLVTSTQYKIYAVTKVKLSKKIKSAYHSFYIRRDLLKQNVSNTIEVTHKRKKSHRSSRYHWKYLMVHHWILHKRSFYTPANSCLLEWISWSLTAWTWRYLERFSGSKVRCSTIFLPLPLFLWRIFPNRVGSLLPFSFFSLSFPQCRIFLSLQIESVSSVSSSFTNFSKFRS